MRNAKETLRIRLRRVIRQRNQAWRALAKIEHELTCDEPSVQTIAWALALAWNAEDVEKFNDVVASTED